MQSAEVIRQLEDHFDPDTLDMQIRYLRAITEAYPRQAQRRRELELLLEARRLMGLLIKQCANRQLGADSPYFGDPELHTRDYRQDYETYQQYRVMTAPRSRATVRARSSTRTSHNRNDLTRRSEDFGGREERFLPMHAHWSGAEKMRQLMSRVDAALAQQKPQPKGWGDCEAVQAVEGTAPTTPAAATAEPDNSPTPEPVAKDVQDATDADTARRLTPLQQAALSAIENWLSVVGQSGSTTATARDPNNTARARRPRPVQAGRLRYDSITAGPGGACFRQAA